MNPTIAEGGLERITWTPTRRRQSDKRERTKSYKAATRHTSAIHRSLTTSPASQEDTNRVRDEQFQVGLNHSGKDHLVKLERNRAGENSGGSEAGKLHPAAIQTTGAEQCMAALMTLMEETNGEHFTTGLDRCYSADLGKLHVPKS